MSGAQTINQADVSPRTRRLYQVREFELLYWGIFINFIIQYTIAMQACLQVEAYFVMMAMVSWFRELTTGRVELEALAGLAGTSGFLFFGTTIVRFLHCTPKTSCIDLMILGKVTSRLISMVCS